MAKKFRERLKSITAGWYVWLFPLFAVLITGWLLKEYYNQRGPTVKIYFDSASSIEPEKTRIRHRGVTIGTVKEVKLSEDNKDVVVYAMLSSEAKRFAVEGTKFSLVVPNVGIQGVSGIETIFEGVYISAYPGDATGPKKTEFKGSIGKDISLSLEDTVSYYLETDRAGSISVGDSVTFRDVKVGTVTDLSFSKTSQYVIVQINVDNRYVKLIRTNTVFWRKMAIDAKLSIFNTEIKVGALDTLLKGGIEFFTPDNPGPIAYAHSKFGLNYEPPKGWEAWNPKLEFNGRNSKVD